MNDDVKHAAFQSFRHATHVDERLRSARDLCSDTLQLVQAGVEHASDSFMITAAACEPPGPEILYVNAAFTRMTGYTAAEVIGRTPRLLQGPATSRRTLDRLRRCLAAGKPFSGETINYRKDGSMFDVEWRIDAIRDATGKITHWVAIQRDITEKKARERAIRAQQHELQRISMLSMQAQISASAIHESLQPLYAIGNLGAACRNAILNQCLETEKEKILAWLDSILAGVNDAKLSLTRLRSCAAGSAPCRETLAFNDVIEPALDMLAHDVERGGVCLHAQLECCTSVNVDSAQIRYVLATLVQYVCAAIQSSVATSGDITLRTWSQDGVCHATVEDDGPSMDHESRADIFSRFQSTKTDMLGLGLALSRAIVKAHRGDIFAEKVESGGLRVGFTIPAVEAPNHE